MDNHLQSLLRDPNTTAEHCYPALRRTGLDQNEIRVKLINANKIPNSEGNQDYYQLLLQMGEIDLLDARKCVADTLVADYDFPFEVDYVGGWTYITNELYCSIHLEISIESFTVIFEPNTALVHDYYLGDYRNRLRRRNPIDKFRRRNPDYDSDPDRCKWVDLRRRTFEQCYKPMMVDGLCLKHYRLWQNLERERLQYEGKADIWADADDDTRVNPYHSVSYRRNSDENFRRIQREYQLSGSEEDYQKFLRQGERAGQLISCYMCNSKLMPEEGLPFRQKLLCAGCFNGDELPCEGYGGECRSHGWVYHDQGRIYSEFSGPPHGESIFTTSTLWCDACIEVAIGDAEHEIEANTRYDDDYY